MDGGLATALQARGLPRATPVNAWLLERPDEVLDAHTSFVSAGAEIVLAGTFRALPGHAVAWERCADRAVSLAREAAGGRAEVWASVGAAATDALEALVSRIAGEVDGIVLETFVDVVAAERALEVVRPLTDRPVVVSLVPAADGTVRGEEPDGLLRRLREAGADGVGFNCGTGPGPVVAAVGRVGDDVPLWARPAGDGTPATVAALVGLTSRCRWVGGCCGVTARDIAEAHTSLRR